MADPTTIRYLRPGLATGSNNGTSEANAWQSWADFNAAALDLTGTTDGWLVKVRDNGPAGITLGGTWFTDSSHRLVIEADNAYTAANGGRHEGLWDAAAAGIDNDASNANLIVRGSSGPDHVTLRGLMVTESGSHPIDRFVQNANTGTLDWIIEDCIVNSGGGSFPLIDLTAGAGTVKIKNCIFRDNQWSGAILLNASSMTVYVHNCTLFDCNLGGGSFGILNTSGTMTVKNTIVSGSTTVACFSGTITQSHNISRDTTSDGTGSIDSVTDTAALFEATGSDDYRIKDGSVADEAGVDLSADGNLAVTTDFLGNTRSAPFDIGAHEVSFVSIVHFNGQVTSGALESVLGSDAQGSFTTIGNFSGSVTAGALGAVTGYTALALFTPLVVAAGALGAVTGSAATSNVTGAELIEYLDLQAGINGTGTIGSPYNTWANWQATAHNLVTANQSYTLRVKNSQNTQNGPGQLSTGWVTDASHRLTIEANTAFTPAQGGRHTGSFSLGCFARVPDGLNAFEWGTGRPTHVTIRGFNFVNENSASNRAVYLSGTGTVNWIVEGCLFSKSGFFQSIYVSGATAGVIGVRNCIANGGSGDFLQVNATSVTVRCHNCTTYNCANFAGEGQFYQVLGTMTCVNCLAVHPSTNVGADFKGILTNSHHNASTDSSATGAGSQTGGALTTPASIFVSPSTLDLRILSSATQVYQTGADLRSDTNLIVTDDFLLQPRDALTDIGAHEASVAAIPDFIGTVTAGGLGAVLGSTATSNRGHILSSTSGALGAVLGSDSTGIFGTTSGNFIGSAASGALGIVTGQTAGAWGTTISGVLENDDLNGHACEAEIVLTPPDPDATFFLSPSGGLIFSPVPGAIYTARAVYRIHDLVDNVFSQGADIHISVPPVTGLLGAVLGSQPTTNITFSLGGQSLQVTSGALGAVSGEEATGFFIDTGSNFIGTAASGSLGAVSGQTATLTISSNQSLQVTSGDLGAILGSEPAALLNDSFVGEATIGALGAPLGSTAQLTNTISQILAVTTGSLGIIAGQTSTIKNDLFGLTVTTGFLGAVSGRRARIPGLATPSEGQGTEQDPSQLGPLIYDIENEAIFISDADAPSGEHGTNMDWEQVLKACYDPVTLSLRTVAV